MKPRGEGLRKAEGRGIEESRVFLMGHPFLSVFIGQGERRNLASVVTSRQLGEGRPQRQPRSCSSRRMRHHSFYLEVSEIGTFFLFSDLFDVFFR